MEEQLVTGFYYGIHVAGAMIVPFMVLFAVKFINDRLNQKKNKAIANLNALAQSLKQQQQVGVTRYPEKNNDAQPIKK